MTLLAALVFTAAAAAPTPEPEIVVIAERLDRIRVDVRRNRARRWSCAISASSGVPSLDSAVCGAVLECVRNGADTGPEARACLTENKAVLLARFAHERAERQ